MNILRFSTLARPGAAIAVIACLAVSTRAAQAVGPVSVTAGADYYSGASGQTTWRPVAELSTSIHDWEPSLEASYFNDNQLGSALGLTGGLKIPAHEHLKLDVQGTGYSGDSTDGAWRARIGPQFEVRKNRNVEVFLQHFGSNNSSANGLGASFDAQWNNHVSSSVGLTLERSDGTNGSDLDVGFGWQPWDLVELAAEAGVSRNASGLTGLLPAGAISNGRGRGGPGPGKSGGGGGGQVATSTTVHETSGRVQLGVRLHF